MNFFWIDSNAGVKRYIAENGTPLVNHLFAQVPLDRMFFLFDAAGEAISVFVRRRNVGELSAARFTMIRQQFETEFILHEPS